MKDNLHHIASVLKKGNFERKSPSKDSSSPQILNIPKDSLKEHELDDDYHKKVRGKGEHWGYHLLVDASQCNKNVDSIKAVENFLTEMVEALEMKRIGKPMVVKVDNAEGRGVSGLQLITTSNIAFHGDNDHWSAYIDIFSCKTFDPKIALSIIKKHFQPKKMGTFWIYRDAGKWPEK